MEILAKKEIIVLPYGISNPNGNYDPFTITLELTPKIAKEWVKRNKLNRPLNGSNLRFLVHEIKNDRWKFNGESIQFDKNGNLINGQHRCEAVILTDKSIKTNVTVGLEKEVFHTIDTGKSRNAADAFAIAGIPRYSAAASIARFIIDFQRKQYYSLGKQSSRQQLVDNGELLEFAKKTPGFNDLSEFSQRIYGESQKFLPQKIIGGLFFFFKKKSKNDAMLFMERLCLGIDIDKESPLFLLRRKLVSERQDIYNKMSIEYKVAIIIKTWNAIQEGQKIKALGYGKKEKFPVIKS